MLGTLFTMNPLLDVDPSAKERFNRELGIELGVPQQIQSLIEQCLSEDASERPAPHQIVEVIKQAPTLSCISARTPLSQSEIHQILPKITSYIRASADVQRKDRLFPGDFLGFLTNSLSIAYGATGVAYALSKIDGEVPQLIQSWLLEQPVNQADYAPGLYIGSAGISWAFWELGFHTISLQIMRSIDNHPLLWDVADVFYGAAGYGLACLHLYLETKGQEWLDRAVEVGEWLLVSKKEDEKRGFYWPDKEGRTHLGYTRGASGIALYLLYLSLMTSEQQFLETGQRALAFDLSFLERTRDGILSLPRGVVGSFENVISHYWLNGSTGVATALLRYWAYTKNPHDLALLEELAPDTFRKYTVHPSLFQGLSGLGNFLLDAYDFTSDKGYLDRAYEAAKSVLLYQVQRPEGVAFPGDQLLRISTDFGTGSAGIALFLHRLAYADQRIGNFNFTLDRLLWDRSGQDNLIPVSRGQEKYM